MKNFCKTRIFSGLLAAFLLVSGIGSAAAQGLRVTGHVSDEAGAPVVGVMVVIDGTNTVAITDGGGGTPSTFPRAKPCSVTL